MPNVEEEDLENEEREFGDVDEASPSDEHGVLPGVVPTASPMAAGGMSMSMMTNQHHQAMSMAAPSQLLHAQQHLLQGQI